MRLFLFFLIIHLTTNVIVGQDDNNAEIPLSQLKQTSQSAKESQEWQTYLETTISIAQAYSDQDLLDSSIWYLEKALDKSYEGNNIDSLWALCHHELGIQYYWITDDLSAIDNWSKALEMRKTILPSNHIDIIKGYRNIGNSHYELENVEEAIKNFNQAYDLNSSRDVPDLLKEAQLALDLSTAYMATEDLDKAFRFLTLAEELYNNNFQDKYWEIKLIYYQWWSYYDLNNDSKMMKFYATKSIKLLQSIKNKSVDDEISVGRALINLGLGFKKEENFLAGIAPFEKAIRIFHKYNDLEGVEKFLAISYSNLSLLYIHLNDHDNALDNIEKALNLDYKLLDQKSIIKDLENKSYIIHRSGNLIKALEIIDEAILLTKSKDVHNAFTVSRPIRVLLNRSKCKILNDLFSNENDVTYLKETVMLLDGNMKIIDELRNSYQSEESKAFLAIDSKKLIEEGINYYVKLYDHTKDVKFVVKAWELSEKAKSIILVESLRMSQAKKQTGVGEELLTKEDSLKKELANIESEIYNRPEDVAILNKSYLESSKELEKISDKISVENPTYSRATKAISNLSLDNLMNLTDSDIVEYFIGEENAYVFTKSIDGINYYTYNDPSEIAELVSQIRKSTVDIFKNSLKKDDAYTATVGSYNQAASRLYEILFGIMGDDITLQEDLLIVPDGVLGYLPFDLLLTDMSKSADFSSKPYLIHKHNISYTYSLALLVEMQDYKVNSNQAMLAMAPSFLTNDEVYKYGDRMVKKDPQPELYFNQQEVESIAAIIESDNVIGSQATESYFMDNAKDYSIIHLSTHGKANDEKGSFSYLAFTEIVDTMENEFVYNYDLYNLKLNADMVVLSACETGIGELKEGEGIISLARGFSYAGAKSIISTLWTINDYRTKEIMESFYTHISEGKDKDWSLRQAKLSFIENNPKDALPFYWAAFIPVGDMSAISDDHVAMPPFAIGGLILLLILIFIFRSRLIN